MRINVIIVGWRSLTSVILGREMNDKQLRVIASIGLIVGALLGMAGTFAPSVSLRGLAWGIDGVAIIVASALLTIYYFRGGQDFIAAGFIVLAIGESLVLSGAAMSLEAGVPMFGSGVGLWAASLLLISAPPVFPVAVRALGLIASLLFTIVALQIFGGKALTAVTAPLPFNAYPFFAATIFGWSWVLLRAKANSEAN
jgi:hypothetical protein